MAEQDHSAPPVACPADIAANSLLTKEKYQQWYQQSIKDPQGFWGARAKEMVTWFRDFDIVQQGDMCEGDLAWFVNGKLNVAYNCCDRHLATRADKVAILWEGDEPGNVRKITYRELTRMVCQFANCLKQAGVRKGDVVCLYMPMVPEAAVAMLACARLGAPHTVVFAGFSSDALRDRIIDGGARFLITADEGMRAGRPTPLKVIADRALAECKNVETVFVYKRSQRDTTVNMVEGRDIWWHEAMENQRPYCPPEHVDSEDTLFLLYTSGSTGQPKGVQHGSGGYLVYASMTHKYVFDYHEEDVYACVADIGWITGHTYIVYGPLCNGATTVMFESTPLYPDAGRYWDMVQRLKINIFYTAPTAIRALMKYGTAPVKKYDRSSLRVLGSVGEPINPEAWKWYHEVVGDGKKYICDTYWQTETGGIMITGIPGVHSMKPGSASFPFFGVNPMIVDEKGVEKKGNDVNGVLTITAPWPGMLRTVYNNNQRYKHTYVTTYKGKYFTGDGTHRDKDGFIWITGRVDDVINVSGHRIGSAEVESALVAHKFVAESAVVGIPHPVKGQALFAYVIPKIGVTSSPKLIAELRNEVKAHVGSFAKPDKVLVTPALPKTRSGKIMRRLLRKIATKDTKNLGDTSTLADPSVVDALIKAVAAM